jgi:hypothetical protein
MPVTPTQTIGGAIQGLLSDARRSRATRRSIGVCAALGPSWVQTKALAGIPKLKHQRLVTQLVRENSSAFFLRTRSTIVLGAIESRDDGATWGAGFDGDVLRAVADAVRTSGLRFERAVPAVSAIAGFVPNGSFAWDDGGWRVCVSTKLGVIHGIRRDSGNDDPTRIHPTLPTAMAGLGRDGWSYVAAFAAARSSRRDAFAWHPEPDPRRSRLVRRIRGCVVGSVLAMSGGAALLSPAIRAARFVSRSSVELSAIRDVQREAARTEAELHRVSTLIDHIARFRSSRGGVTLLLAGLAETLPESTAMVSLRVDSLEGSFVALAPHVADVVPQLLTIDRIVAPRIVGSITPETMNAVRLERATLRFRRRRPASTVANTSATSNLRSRPRSAAFQ